MTIYSITSDETQADTFKHRKRQEKLQAIGVGGFGGGALKFQFRDEGGTWRDLPDASYTAAFSKTFELKGPMEIRYDVSGSTTPTITLQLN